MITCKTKFTGQTYRQQRIFFTVILYVPKTLCKKDSVHIIYSTVFKNIQIANNIYINILIRIIPLHSRWHRTSKINHSINVFWQFRKFFFLCNINSIIGNFKLFKIMRLTSSCCNNLIFITFIRSKKYLTKYFPVSPLAPKTTIFFICITLPCITSTLL